VLVAAPLLAVFYAYRERHKKIQQEDRGKDDATNTQGQ